MSDPLLSYSITTLPLPLQVGATGASISIAASNPGFYSDKPDSNYVAATKIVFDFGGALTQDPSNIAASAIYTPSGKSPVSWPPPQRTGAVFTFNPPAGTKIFPSDGLSFQFTNISVSPQVSSATLNLTETASSPGDPQYPNIYPPQPSQARFTTSQIGIFPANFSISTFSSSPTNVMPGQPAQLSWTASNLANTSFKLVYAVNGVIQTVTQHADNSPLKATDTYPNSAKDPGVVLSINQTTTFSLQATYVEGGTVVTATKQVIVSVPNPTITSFTVAPTTNLMVGDTVQMSWQTLAADYVTITPPLDGVNPVVPNNGAATIYPLEYTRYTLTASGRGLNVRQSQVLFPMPPGWTTVTLKAPWKAALAPLTLAINGLLWALPADPSMQAGSNPIYSSPDGLTWILVKLNAEFSVRKNAAAFSDSANQKAWVMGGIGIGGGALNDVWSSTDGKTWSQITASAQWSARSDFGCVWFNNQYWVMGGIDGNGNLLNDIWTSPNGVTWTKQSAVPAWSPRSAFGLTVFNGKMWLFGGKTSSGLDNGLWCSSDGASWQNPSDPFDPALPGARTNCQMFGSGTNLYVIGGIDRSGNGLSDASLFSSSQAWATTSAATFPPGSKYFGATAFSGALCLLGGANDNAFGSGVWLFAPSR